MENASGVGKRFCLYILFSLVLFSSAIFAYDLSITTDSYIYSVNESIYAKGIVKQNSTAVSNATVAFQAKDVSGNVVNSSTLTSNSTGEFNYTFYLSTTGNYTLLANASGSFVNHFIKVKSYSAILSSTDKPTYTAGANGTVSVKVIDSSGNGVASQVVSNNLRHATNNTLISNLTSCTTNTLGECSINFTAPSVDGLYEIENNNFEHTVFFTVGGFDAIMKITPNVVGLNGEVTMKVTVKNANGNGVSASTRQLVITFPNSTEYTITSMTQAVDSSGNSVTGAYEDRFNATGEGVYKVKATVTAQGSNITKELVGSFEVRGYVMEVVPWTGQSVFYPGSSIALGVKLRNASTNDFISGKASTILSGATILDSSDQAVVVNLSVSEFAALNSYRVDFVMPSTSLTGTYRLKISLNDSVGTGLGVGYFSIQTVKATATAYDTFNGSTKTNFLAAQPVVVKFSAKNASGNVNVTSLSSYNIKDRDGNDATALFGTGVSYASGDSVYLNLSTPNKGGDYSIKGKLTTAAGTADAEGSIFVSVLDISARPVSIGSGGFGSFTPFAGPGFMFSFRPNDTIAMNITVRSASEKQEGREFMGDFSRGGAAATGGFGLFGIGGGSAQQGAQVMVSKIINTNTFEDLTSSITGTLSCVTDTNGICTISMQPTTNGNNWTGGFYTVFMNATTSNNQTDEGRGFFEVRRYYVDVRTTAAVQDNASSLGFNSFSSWNIGPTDNVIVNVTIRESGTWNTVPVTFNVTVLGIYYGGKLGEFIYPPKLIDGTTKTFLTSTANGTTINAPSGGWKSGFYQVRVSVNTSGQIDTAEGFMMSRIYEGFGFPVNPTSLQQDFTARSNENVTLKVSVYDVQRHTPAANLTVTKNKILSFTSFPPAELSYDKNVTQGTTDGSGVALMTLEPPSGGWPKGSFLAVFDVTNGSVTDSVEGFFQIKNFFAELTTSKWQFSGNESIGFNVTISSDPSWMRNAFGGCPPGDPGCSSGGGGGGGGGGNFVEPTNLFYTNATGIDLDGDSVKDVNITIGTNNQTNLSLIGDMGSQSTQNISMSRTIWCGGSNCAPGAVNAASWFESVNCAGNVNTTDYIYKNFTHNFSGPAIVCITASGNRTYKLGAGMVETPRNMSLSYIQEVSGSVGGSTGLNVSSSSGISYFNATLKSIKVSRFDFSVGETLLAQGVDYNVTSANGVIVGAGNITIPGVGGIKIKPISRLSNGFYHVVAEFNTSDGSEITESGFQIDTYSANCYRAVYGSISSSSQVNILCYLNSPTGGLYPNSVDIVVEKIKNSNTQATMSTSLWSSAGNRSDPGVNGAGLIINQTLPNGFYEAVIKINETTDVKRISVWFDVKDFDTQFWSEKWSYSSGDNITLTARGAINWYEQIRVNISGSPTVFRYDKSTWAKSTVSDVTAVAQVDRNSSSSWYRNITLINLSKSGGWDEGQYQVVLNITKIDGSNAAVGNPVEVSSWFDVKLFEVWAYPDSWSFHPKNNVTIKVFVGNPASYNSRHTGRVLVNITEVKNTVTGAVLTKGTDYNVVDNTTIPSVTGDVPVNITPIGALPAGYYKARISVTDVATSRSISTDVYFNAVAYYFSAWTEQYEVGAGDNISIILYANSPSGAYVNLTGANITALQFCPTGNASCSNLATTSFNFTYINSVSKIILNSTPLSAGSYVATVVVNDTQNVNTSTSVYFRIKPFVLNGYMLYPGYRSGYGHMINETMKINITGTPGVNVTNATFSYYDCGSTCTYKTFVVQIGYNMTSKNVVLNLTPANITPSILNNSWPTNEQAYYSVEVKGVKDGTSTSFYAYTGVYFPRATTSGPSSITTSTPISTNITVWREQLSGQGAAGANVTVSEILQDTGYSLTPLASSRWNISSIIVNSSGVGEIKVLPNSPWPSGTIRARYTIVLGNATTKGEFSVYASKPVISLTRYIANVSGGPIANATLNKEFNITTVLQNPSSSLDANNTGIFYSIPTHSSNSSAVIRNLSSRIIYVNITSLSSVTVNVPFNVTAGKGNYSISISVSPSSDFSNVWSPLTFEVK